MPSHYHWLDTAMCGEIDKKKRSFPKQLAADYMQCNHLISRTDRAGVRYVFSSVSIQRLENNTTKHVVVP